MIGNPNLPNIITFAFTSAKGEHGMTASPNEKDIYRHLTDLTLQNVHVTFQKNLDFLENGNAQQNIPAQHRNGYTFAYNCWRDEANFHCGLDEEHILKAKKMRIKYIEDVPGLVRQDCFKKSGGQKIYNLDKAPKSLVGVDVWDPIINFGGWADHKRFLMQYLFFPPQNLTEKENFRFPNVGEERPFDDLKMVVKVLTSSEDKNVVVRVPFRRANRKASFVRKDLEKEQEKAVGEKMDWLKVNSKQVLILLEIPFYSPVHLSGTSMVLSLDAKDLSLSTSLNDSILLSSRNFKLDADLFTPYKKGATSVWKFDFNLSKSNIWFLFDHTFFFQDFVSDWLSHEKKWNEHTKSSPNFVDRSSLAYYWPIHYKLDLNLSEFSANLNVNQFNIIDKHNNLEENGENKFFLLK